MLHLTFSETGTAEAQKRAGVRREQLERGRKVLIRSEGQRLIRFLREDAPKKTGIFAKGITGSVVDTALGTTVMEIVSTGEHAFLLNYIVGGTRPHEIPKGGSAAQLAKGYPLRFYWEKGPGGPGIYYFWSVRHPGTKPNNFPRRARIRWQPWATRRLREVGMFIRRAQQIP